MSAVFIVFSRLCEATISNCSNMNQLKHIFSCLCLKCQQIDLCQSHHLFSLVFLGRKKEEKKSVVLEEIR